MDSTQSQARRAGILYFLAGLPAPFAYLYVPGVLLVPNDALGTADRVRASENLLRAAVIVELYSSTLVVFAILALYQLLKRVDARTAILMAALMLLSVPISYVNSLLHVAPLVLLDTSAIAAVLDPGQVAAQVTFFLRLHGHGLVVAQIFWGLWLFPLGILIMRSGFIPRWIAFPLFLAGAGYLVNSLGLLVLPPALRWIAQAALALGVGELPLILWLVIWGARLEAKT